MHAEVGGGGVPLPVVGQPGARARRPGRPCAPPAGASRVAARPRAASGSSAPSRPSARQLPYQDGQGPRPARQRLPRLAHRAPELVDARRRAAAGRVARPGARRSPATATASSGTTTTSSSASSATARWSVPAASRPAPDGRRAAPRSRPRRARDGTVRQPGPPQLVERQAVRLGAGQQQRIAALRTRASPDSLLVPSCSATTESSDTATATTDWAGRSSGAGVPTARKPRTRPLAPSGCRLTGRARRPRPTRPAARGRAAPRPRRAARPRARRPAHPDLRVPHAARARPRPAPAPSRRCAGRAGAATAAGPARAQSGPGQVALGLERARDRVVLLGAEQRRHRLADRDERGGRRHLEQRQARARPRPRPARRGPRRG